MDSHDVIPSYKDKDAEEILTRIESYENPQTTPLLYDLGTFLLHKGVEQTNGLDAKAGILIGFVGAIIALLLSSFSKWQHLAVEIPGGWAYIFFGFCLLACTAVSVLIAHRPRHFEWLDEKDVWFAKKYLDFPDQLRRYYLIGMYRAAASRDRVNARKMNWLLASYVLLLIGTALLSVPLFYKLWHLGAQRQLAALWEAF